LAKTDHCPICNVAVKPENLLRHLNDTHPRNPDTPRLREALRQEPGRIRPKGSSAPIHIKKWHVAVVALLVLGGFGVYYLTTITSQPFPCVTVIPDQLAYHWHTTLKVYSGSTPVTIPANVGLNAVCVQPLHTHDASGTIHVETDVNRLYSIGDFYRVWGKPFDTPTQMNVNGTAVSPSPNVVLYDLETIDVYYASFS